MNHYKGVFAGSGCNIAIVISRFNSQCTTFLLEGAHDCLVRHGIADEDIDVFWVPGAFEIPYTLQKIANAKQYDGILALGTIIRGDTPHFDVLSNEVTKGIAQLNLSLSQPIGFGIITADTLEQALQRSGAKSGNKGFEAALSMIEMVQLTKQIQTLN
jgi:6,7-dimethyl-8-ribityllumazine synthase